MYANGPQKAVQIIPAKKDLIPEGEKKKLRVCAYCRVSTDEDNQASSYELQVQNYTKMIRENPEWEFAGIFADEGISGTSVLHREQFLAMIEKCKAGGNVNLIFWYISGKNDPILNPTLQRWFYPPKCPESKSGSFSHSPTIAFSFFCLMLTQHS